MCLFSLALAGFFLQEGGEKHFCNNSNKIFRIGYFVVKVGPQSLWH